MMILDSILHLEFSELVAAGISDNTIKRARYNDSVGWTFTDHPHDGRKVLVAWPLKEPYQTQVLEHYGDPQEYHRGTYLESILPECRGEWDQLNMFTTESGTGLGQVKIRKLHEAARWMTLCMELRAGGDHILSGLGMSRKEFWAFLPQYLKVRNDEPGRVPVKLPNRYQKLLEKVRKYEKEGVASLVHGNLNNNNGAKLCEAAKHWLLSTYSLVTKPEIPEVAFRYAEKAGKKGWEAVSESCIYMFLNKPENKRVWYLARHGYRAWKAKYEHNLKLALPTFRDALWVMDGTKLNLFYQDENGMAAKLQINKCMDAFSEAIIGYDIMLSENHVSAYVTLKRAVQFAQARPYQVLYDGQGGYKKAETQGFLTELSSVHFPAQPYNAQSKHVESLIKRFQTQVMRKHWFFTGQNVTAKKEDSKPNYDFIMAHQKDLPTLDEVMKVIIPRMIEEWNNGKHPITGEPRIDMYNGSENPEHRDVTYLDMVNIFWLTREQETYKKDGLKMEVAKRKYHFEVYTEDGLPDGRFLEQYTGQKFIVKYDPEDMQHVRLYLRDAEGDLRFVAAATTKKEFARAVIDLTPGMRAEIDENLSFRKAQRTEAERIIEESNRASGVSSEALIRHGYAMGNKDEMNAAEEDYVLAEVSHADPMEERKRRNRQKWQQMKDED